METEARLIAGTMAVITVAIAEFTHHRNKNRRSRKILEALEEFEATGISGVHEDINTVAQKWTLLRLASNDPGKYKVSEYKDRIDTQLKAFEPYSEKLRHHMSIGAGVNLGGILTP